MDGCVDALLGHLTIRGPFAAGAGEEAGGGDVDEVVADEGLGVLRLGVFDEGSDAGPGCEDVASADVDVGGQVVADFLKDPFDGFLIGERVLGDGRGRVGGAGDGVALPGEEEDDSAVRGGGVDEAHLGGSVVAGEDDMDAG